jgi:hypothetical protein
MKGETDSSGEQHTLRLAGLLICAAFCVLALSGCEIVYDDMSTEVSDKIPEFRLSGARVTRYEDGQMTAELSAKTVEQYKQNNAIYASGVTFVVYDSDGKEIGHGNCGLILADTTNDTYVLFDSIVFENIRDQFELRANAIRWGSNTGILASSRDGTVEIIKTRTGNGGNRDSRFSLSGTRFFADKNTRAFVFGGPVSGIFDTGDGDEPAGETD